MHPVPSETLVLGEETLALRDSWTPSSSMGTSESWLGLLAVVMACCLGCGIQLLLTERVEPSPRQGSPPNSWSGWRGRCNGLGSASRVFLHLAALTEEDHTQAPKRATWAIMLCLACSASSAETTYSCFYELATSLPFPFCLVTCCKFLKRNTRSFVLERTYSMYT